MNLLRKTIRTLLEVPIGDFDVIGRKIDPNKPGSFNKQDRKLLSNPKAIEKIKKQWEKTPYTFDIYLLNEPSMNRLNFREYGIVDGFFSNWFKEAMGSDVPNRSDAITILFNGNSGAERVPLTGWMMAHRFAHVLRGLPEWKYYIESVVELTKRILEEVYNKTMNNLSRDGIFRPSDLDWKESPKTKENMITLFFNQIGSFKSAREGKIKRYYEFFFELFAQYLLTGNVNFRPLEKSIIIRNLPFGRKQIAHAVDDDLVDMWNRDLEIYASEIESRIINVLEDCVGKTFLM